MQSHWLGKGRVSGGCRNGRYTRRNNKRENLTHVKEEGRFQARQGKANVKSRRHLFSPLFIAALTNKWSFGVV
ncbi:hypothetical protein NC652_018615 [Populus alba x Populus x berolinensis]|nr:hypothetical protein NC652_018615 [Populus alba x Populus x berolinensis]